ncbi:TPA: hypothetical protein ACT1UT_001844 [Raoultella planticola]
MTSKLTREKAQWLHDACEEAADAGIKLTMNPNELLMFTSYALAAMDSEPVAYIDKQWTLVYYVPPMNMDLQIGDKLFRHTQPAPVVPDGLLSMAASAIEDLLEHTDPNTSYYSGVWADVPSKLRAAMIAAAPQDEAKKDKPHNNFGTGARLTNHRFKV